MSEPTRDTANTTVTIWPILNKGDYGQITYAPAYTVKAAFKIGSSRQYNDANGSMYIPSSIYWYEYNGTYPGLNDMIAIGSHLAITDPLTVSGVESIKNRLLQDNSILDDTDDIMVLT